jgi:dihydrofolate synthase/folylpolyglutamate synthase
VKPEPAKVQAADMIDWLYGLQHFGIKLGLDNIRAVLEILEHPERSYASVHIAGTNGKGSVAAMVDAMLDACGVASGLFTSPHLVRPHERIRIAGKDIDDAELQDRLRRLREIIESGLAAARLEVHPSFFEVVTATALQAFAEHGVGAAVLEVGLGGRLDATNAVDADVAVVVSIGLDHTKTLGPSLEQIAREKGGIVKPGQPVVCGATQQRVLDVLTGICSQRGAEFIDARRAARLTTEGDDSFELETARSRYPDLSVSLPGRHQMDNARVALVAFELLAERLGIEPDPAAVREGLSAVRWPGRLQWIEPAGHPRMLLDGAHNPPGIAAVTAYLRGIDLPPPVLLCGATSGKSLQDLLGPLAPLVHRVVITRPPVERGLDPHDVAREIGERFGSVEAIPDPAEALERACAAAGEERYVLVTGSLYLVGRTLGLITRRTGPGPVAM